MYIPTIPFNTASRMASDTLEFLPLASTPCEDPCTQAGDNFRDQELECCALIHQLIRIHGAPPENASFFIVKNYHGDAGMYLEAGIWYRPTQEEDDQDSPSEVYALKCEMLPEKWDETALKELRDSGHSKYQPAKVVQMRKIA